MTEIEEKVEAIYQDADLTREEKIAGIAALFGITDPISAPDLFAHIRSSRASTDAQVTGQAGILANLEARPVQWEGH